MSKSGLVFVLAIFVYTQSRIFVGALIGTALYCRDPDTGKLHAPNTTWPSTTFCGNYACKLRKKNDSNAMDFNQNVPKPDLNIPANISTNENENKQPPDNIDNSRPFASIDHDQLARKSNYDNMAPDSMERMDSKIDNSFSKPTPIHDNNPSKKLFKISKLEDALGENDRYLSEDEIKFISELLYTVKKSDLEAIVDIYNLAQDIYNEMERPVSNDVLNFQKQRTNDGFKPYISPEPAINRNSYWYEPIQNDVKSENQAELLLEPSNILLSSPSGMGNYITTQNPPANQQKAADDYMKLPYNTLITNYQSYLQRIPSKTVAEPVNLHPKSVAINPTRPNQRAFAPHWPAPKVPETSNYDNVHHRSNLVPNLFSQIRYYLPSSPNTAYYEDNSFNKIGLKTPSAQIEVKPNPPPKVAVVNPLVLDISPLNEGSRRNSITKFLTDSVSLMNNMPNAIYTPENQYAVDNSYISNGKYMPESVYDSEFKREPKANAEMPKTIVKSGWITDSLPKNVIDAIRAKIDRANINRSYKSYFPAKRMVKLEKVGRSIKRNEIYNRKKREQSWDDYEVVIERKTCVTDETIGFFRKGNESEPFPNCCPQRIQVW